MEAPLFVSEDAKLAAIQPLLSAKSDISSGQIGILVLALFVKGGVLGAYLPFSAVWLDAKGYVPYHLGLLALVDSVSSLSLPLVGTCMDKFRSHNTSFVLMLVMLSILKLCYLPAAGYFSLLLVLSALTSPLLRACTTVLDALALYAFAERGHFGRARLVGDLGWGFVALFVGWLLDVAGTMDVIFITFAGMCLFLALLWTLARPWMSSIRSDSVQMGADEFRAQVAALIARFACPGVARAGFMLVLFGMSTSMIATFELVLVKRLSGSGLILGLIKLFGSFASIPVWYFTGPVLDRIGLRNLQLLGLVFVAIRMLILGVIKHPAQALFSECFSGLGGFAMAYCSVTVFSGRMVDEDLKGTSQTLIFTVFAGFGAGFGPIVASLLIEVYGLQAMFFYISFCFVGIAIILLWYDAVEYFVRGTYTSLEEEIGPRQRT